MKYRLLFFVLLLAMSGCVSNKGKYVAKVDNDSRFILDYDSRLAQQAMKKHRFEYGASTVGAAAVEGAVEGLVSGIIISTVPCKACGRRKCCCDNPHMNDADVHTEKIYRTLVLKNTEKDTVYFDLLTEQKIDESLSCSVKKVYLPPQERITLLLPYSTKYELQYGKEAEGKKENSEMLLTTITNKVFFRNGRIFRK
ncbi:hypothetical protein AAG747_14350 [Rapidithrix thailandica]|uniref:Lipoprotein n=1 Tax=Rapidithrix thailandica TaxID=413964 RepID=A0AAW9S1P7_9BACT